MTAVAWIDLVSFVSLTVAIAGIIRGWKSELSRDALFLLLGIAVASLLHSTSNVLEWSGITAAIDPYEDYFQLIEPILWFFFAYSFVRSKEMKDLHESQERYRSLYEDLPDAVLLADADSGIILGANAAATRLFGRPLKEIQGMHQTDLHPAKDSPVSQQIFFSQRSESELRGHAHPVLYSIVRSDGQHIPVEITSRLVSLSGRPVMQGVFRDVSKQQSAAALVQKEKERAQQYLDVADVALIALDREGRITLINQRGVKILEYESDQELLGRDWFETCVPTPLRDEVRGIFQRIVAGEMNSLERRENPVLTRSGKQRIIAWNKTMLHNEDDSIAGTLSSGEDVTEQRQAEKERTAMESQLRQVQKLESIGTLASGAAHEINNPLTGIINYAQLIHDRLADDSLRTLAAGIMEEGNRIAQIVKGLLSFSRQETEAHSPAFLSDIVDATLSLIGSLLEKDRITLFVDIHPDLPWLNCRAQQIEQVLINLLLNARDALNDRYPAFDDDKILKLSVDAFNRDEAPWVRVIIEDHGSGIPPDLLGRIFDPFFSTKPREKGTGLGLSISYGLVREHHGYLLAESEPNTYTRFTIELPVQRNPLLGMGAGMEGTVDGKNPDRR